VREGDMVTPAGDQGTVNVGFASRHDDDHDAGGVATARERVVLCLVC
jgi:hypothetical protein